MPPPVTKPISQTVQGLAAVAVYGARTMSDLTNPESDSLEKTQSLLKRVSFENLKAFMNVPEVRNAAKGAAAVGTSMALCHGIENQLAGTDALRRLGQSILATHPGIARILARNPNAALVAGTVAFPYAASPFFERWFKTALCFDASGEASKPHPDWQTGFMTTVANWNHVQPLIGAVLKHHPAIHAVAGPLATGLMNSGADAIKSAETHRLASLAEAQGKGGAEASNDSRPTAGETATAKAVASQTRYFADAIRQAFKKNAHMPNLATEFIASNLYPGWVAAVSGLYAREIARRLHESNASRASGEEGGKVEVETPVDIVAMLGAADGRELIEHIAARPDMFRDLKGDVEPAVPGAAKAPDGIASSADA
ncbi:hypothetical protein BH09PSE5_BH09PSE5_15440 [soil metagenome]